MGLGFLVMFECALSLAFSGFIVAGVLVTWGYWFGWTSSSWRIADTQALAVSRQP